MRIQKAIVINYSIITMTKSKEDVSSSFSKTKLLRGPRSLYVVRHECERDNNIVTSVVCPHPTSGSGLFCRLSLDTSERTGEGRSADERDRSATRCVALSLSRVCRVASVQRTHDWPNRSLRETRTATGHRWQQQHVFDSY